MVREEIAPVATLGVITLAAAAMMLQTLHDRPYRAEAIKAVRMASGPSASVNTMRVIRRDDHVIVCGIYQRSTLGDSHRFVVVLSSEAERQNALIEGSAVWGTEHKRYRTACR